MKRLKILIFSIVLALISSAAHAGPSLIPYTPDPTTDRTPTVTWQAVSGAVDYRVQIDDDSSFATPLVQAYTSGATNYTPASNLPVGNIYWRVSSNQDYSDYSGYDHFVIELPGPPVLTPYTPDPTTDRTPTLSWQPVLGAADYMIQIDDDSSFATPLVQSSTSGATSYTSATNLPAGDIYWRVSSSLNEGVYSSYDHFVLDPDSDADGVPDSMDGCPNDPAKTAPGVGGCGIPDVSVIPGDTVMVSPMPRVSVTLQNVSEACTLATSFTSVFVPMQYRKVGNVYEIKTDCDMSLATVCLSYAETDVLENETLLELHHLNGSAWENDTTSLDTDSDIICADVTTFSPFVVVEPPLAPASGQRIAGGGSHSLAIKTDGSLCAWGINGSGQLGDGTTTNRSIPVQVLTGVQAIAAGAAHSLALKTDSTLWAWGRNGVGQLGDGTITDRSSPVQVLTGVQIVAAGGFHTLALKNDGTLWAWGGNNYGQLGNGTTAYRLTPLQVLSGVRAVAAGGYHTLALKSDGTLWVWGANEKGQLGDDTTTNRSTPVQVMTGVQAVAAGNSHTLALKNDGTLWAWGDNSYGQLGDGTIINRTTPVQVLSGVQAIAAGYDHTLAVKNDGTLWAWGWNVSGQVGDGTTTNRSTPVQVLTGVQAIAAGAAHSLALLNDGTLWSWGNNWWCQLGHPYCDDAWTPTQSLFSIFDLDSDGDGTPDSLDDCPAEPSKTAAGQCGCGIADTDSDGDGTANCLDNCPADSNKTAAGQCGCGVSDTDTDLDGIADCIELLPKGTVSGSVVDAESGQPLAGIEVCASEVASYSELFWNFMNPFEYSVWQAGSDQSYCNGLYGQYQRCTFCTITSLDGTYAISDITFGTYVVIAHGNDLFEGMFYGNATVKQTATLVGVASGETTFGIDFSLLPLSSTGSISGRVVADDTGVPLEGLTVQLYSPSGNSSSANTDSSGNFVFSGLRPGTYQVKAEGDGSWPGQGYYAGEYYNDAATLAQATSVLVQERLDAPLGDFRLVQGGSISGTVIDGRTGLPVPDTCIVIQMEIMGFSFCSSKTDESGHYLLTGIPSHAEYTVISGGAWSDTSYAWQKISGVSVEAPGNTVVDFVLTQGGSISGTVTSAPGTSGISPDVYVYDPLTKEYVGGGYYNVNADGTYTVEGLPEGEVMALTFDPLEHRYAPQVYDGVASSAIHTPIHVVAGETTTGINFTVEAAGTISGQVLNADGRPVPGVTIVATDRNFNELDFSPGFLDDNGNFRIFGVPPGEVYIEIRKAGSGQPALYYPGVTERVQAQKVVVSGGAETSNVIITWPDFDGIPAAVEDAAPNNGDGNNDGVSDSDQDNVASLLSAAGDSYITVETITAGSGSGLTAVAAIDKSTLPADPQYNLPYDLVGFTVVNPTNPGFSETVRLYFHGVADLSGYVYRKFDPSTSTWYTLPDVVFGVEVIGGEPVAFADLPLTDGGAGDADHAANGTIVDPGGPGLPICTLTADFDADNDVDINDYNTFKQNWGWSGAAGSGHTADFDNDGDVDINDYNTFKQNWGKSCQ